MHSNCNSNSNSNSNCCIILCIVRVLHACVAVHSCAWCEHAPSYGQPCVEIVYLNIIFTYYKSVLYVNISYDWKLEVVII